MEDMAMNNDKRTCIDCPEVLLRGHINFDECGHSQNRMPGAMAIAECARRPELGVFCPHSRRIVDCPEWVLDIHSGTYILRQRE